MHKKIMAHVDEVKKVLQEKGFNLEKFEFCWDKRNYSLLSIGSDKQMTELKYRVNKAERVILYIEDKSPTFYPAIINSSYFDMIKVIFQK